MLSRSIRHRLFSPAHPQKIIIIARLEPGKEIETKPGEFIDSQSLVSRHFFFSLLARALPTEH